MSLDSQIEAVLFYKTEPFEKDVLAAFFEVSRAEADAGLQILADRLKIGGTRLIMTDTTVQLLTAPEHSELIERLKKDELSSDIGKAGAETLAIITYRGPLSRAEIDKIRGVNSTFIIRNLLVRGLIERRDHPSDSRSFTYAVTPMLLSYLGVTTREELPDFESVMNAVDSFEKNEELSVAESIT